MKVFKKIISTILRISISALILIFLFRQIDTKSLLKLIKNADKLILLFAFCAFFISYILALYRWEMLLKGAKVHLPLKRVVIAFAGGVFFSLFLPSTIGGDLMRSIDLAAHTKRPREVVATVFLDRLSGYIGLVIVALLALAFGWRFIQDKSVAISIAIITGVLIAILLVLFNKVLYSKINKLLHSATAGKIREAIKNLHQEIHYFRHHKKIILNNLALSLLIQAILPIASYIMALSLGIKINLIYFFIFVPIIGAITLLPVTMGGLGLRDFSTVVFFAKAGVSKDLALAMSLLTFFFILIHGIIGGLIYVLTIHHRRLQHHKPQHIHPHS